jgi:polyhydroxybutyrate depolymerase
MATSSATLPAPPAPDLGDRRHGPAGVARAARNALRSRRLGLPLGMAAALAGALISLAVPVRPAIPEGARAFTRSVQVGDRRRQELVVEPARRPEGRRLPLYVVLHGSDATPAYEERRTELAPLAAAGKALLLYPQGIDQTWNAGGGCCGRAGALRVDDVGFVEAVIADAVANLGADPERVYLVGYSNGGRLALRVASADPGAFAGVAVYAATPTVDITDGAPFPVLVSGGTDDGRIPFDGPAVDQRGVSSPSVSGTVEILRRRDGVGADPTVETLAGGKVRVETWRGKGPRQVVRFVIYEGRDHTYPQVHNSPLPLAPLIESFFASLPDRAG